MSKRAEQRALEAYPAPKLEGCSNILYDLEGNHREGFVKGYEQGQKETIERVIEWLKEHAEEYAYTRLGKDTCTRTGKEEIISSCWVDLRKAMEEEV